jgi:Flp pilus assembly protein TadD
MSRTLYNLGFAIALLAWLGAAPALPAQDPTEEAADLIQRALAEVEGGDLEAAIALLEPARAGNPPPELRAVLGALYLEASRPEDALAVLGPVAQAEDADAAVLYNAGRAAVAIGGVEQGQVFLERSLTLEPGTPAIRELGLLYGLQGRIRDAYRLLMPWLEQNPEDPQARRATALAALRLGRIPTAERLLANVPQTQPADKMLWGHLLLLKGDPHGAISLLSPLLAASAAPLPAQLDHDVRWVLAESYVQVGEAEEAVGVLEGVAVDAPSILLLGRARYQSGDPEGALATLAPLAEPIIAAQQHDRNDPRWTVATEIAREYGRWLVAAGRYEEAIPYLEIATEMEPSRKETWQALGQALAAGGRQEEARAALEEFQRLAQAAGGETDQIERMRLAREDPTAAAMDRAQRLVGEGDREGALAVVRQEAELVPDDLRPRLFEAWLLLSMDRAEEALRLSEALLRGAPDNPDVLHQRGAAMMAVDRTIEAEADFRRALELNPGHVPAMNDLAVLLVVKGDREEARALLERVLEIRPEDPQARETLERLRG